MEIPKIIGIAGVARSGKDTFCHNLISYLKDEFGLEGQRIAFADEIKSDLDQLLLKKTGISAFTQDSKEKEFIRPLLVCYGTEIMRKINKDYWVQKVEKTIENNVENNIISIITDIRFENELDWLCRKKALSIFVERAGVEPANQDELDNYLNLKRQCDERFSWPTFSKQVKDQCLTAVIKKAHGIFKTKTR